MGIFRLTNMVKFAWLFQDYSFYDYCANIDDEERKDEVGWLVEHALPKGMFSLTGEDTIRYEGGMERWKEEYVANVHRKAEAVTVENMWRWSTTYDLRQAIENPLGVDFRFYLNGDGCQTFAEAPLPLWILSTPSNRVRRSTSAGSSTIITDVPAR